MFERLAVILFLLMIPVALCSPPEEDAEDDDEDYDPEFRGFPDYDGWKPDAQQSVPEVILIKQKDPGLFSGSSISSAIKDNLPLLAVLAPLVAVAVLLPLKAYLGPAYVVYPPAAPPAPPAPPASLRDRVGKIDNGLIEEQILAAQILKMIEEMDKMYGDMAAKDQH